MRRSDLMELANLPFEESVIQVVKMIPSGRVTSYGRIARALGAPRSARMVGWILNHLQPDAPLPAHRVVNRVGVLTGAVHFGPPDRMRELLEAEGVEFLDEQTVDMEKYLWDPSEDPRVDAYYRPPMD